MLRVRITPYILSFLVVFGWSLLLSGCHASMMASADSFMIQDKSELVRNKKFKDTRAYKKSKTRRKYYTKKRRR